MKKRILTISSYILVAVLATALTLWVWVRVGNGGNSKLQALESLIEERFVGETDTEALEDAAADAMVRATGDRWSYYIPASQYEAYTEQMANAYVGVGITIQLQEEDAGFLIMSVTPGGPAEEAGLQVNDLIIAVAGEDVRGMTTDAVRDLVRGEVGTTVSMTVLRKGENLSFSVERRKVETPVASFEMLPGDVGLVTIENFDSRCAEETIAAIQALMNNGARMLIFDVRNNPGGYADEMVDVLDYLLPEGELFRAVTYDGRENVDTSDESCLDVPMAVLVNASSYSAAEFFAAALREYDAAVVVGEQTSGKGYFQNTFQFDDGSAVALSVGKYFTPQGNSLQDVGITPDVEVTVDEETSAAIYYGTLAAQDDPQVQAAVQALEK